MARQGRDRAWVFFRLFVPKSGENPNRLKTMKAGTFWGETGRRYDPHAHAKVEILSAGRNHAPGRKMRTRKPEADRMIPHQAAAVGEFVLQ